MASERGEGRIDDVLDQQAWLMRLARQLGRDAATAEELAQESLIAAWEHPPRERGSTLRSWLRSVLVHRARTGATAEQRRREREERSARPEAVAGSDEIAERLELARRVAAALDELPEAERRALYLRYYEELSPPDIARAVGAPLGTIKSRLAQGREHLRRKLDREYGERGTWLGLLLPLAPLTRTPDIPSSASPSAGPAGPLLLGTATMTTKATLTSVAAAAIIASLLVWNSWTSPADSRAAAPRRGQDSELASGTTEHSPAMASSRAESPPRVEMEALAPDVASASTTAGVEIAATFASDGSPAALLVGSLAPENLAWKEDGGHPIRRVQLDAEGHCFLAGLEPGVWVARLNGRTVEGGVVELAPGATAQVQLSIQPGIEVRGRVLDHQESPVPGAEVFSSWSGDHPGQGTLAVADATGRFALRDLAPWQQSGPYTAIAARAPGRLVSREWEATGKAGDAQVLVLRVGSEAGSLQGRVVDSEGQPVEGAIVEFPSWAWPQEIGLSREGLHLEELPDLELQSGSDGSFTCDRLPPGLVGLCVKTEVHPTWQGSVTIEAGRTSDLEIRLGRGGALEGIVLDAEGKPAPNARILAGWPSRLDSSESQGHVVPGWPGRSEPRKARTDAEGRYRIVGLDPGPCEVHAMLQFGRAVQTEVPIAAGETRRWDVQLLPSERASGKVVDESGAPLANWAVHVIEPSRKGLWLVSARTDAAGRFALENCPEGPKEIEVCLPVTFAAPAILTVPFPDDERELTLVVPERARPSATLAGRFVDSSGADVDSIEVWLNSVEFNWGKQILPDRATQAFEYGPLVPGSYRLSVRAEGYVEPTLEISDLTVGEVRDLGAIELVRGARLALAFVALQEGASSDRAMLQLERRDGLCKPDVVEGSSWSSPQLPPGEWIVRAAGPQMALCEMSVTLVAGETVSRELEIRPGTSRSLLIEPADGAEGFTLEVYDAQGKPCANTITRFGASAEIHGLTVGTWRVVAYHPDGRSGETELSILTLEPQTQPLTLAVR
jgi:RNA polymerase sigma factor (sigma-70 family)